MEFLAALAEHAFLQRAVATGLLASVACGVVGSYVVARRITYVAGGIAHCLLAGLGVARYLQVTQGWEWLHPLYGAVVVALLTAGIIGWVSLRWTEREDTVISALWAVGMAVGILFISLTPGYSQDLMSYLFGNILMVTAGELWLIGLLDLIVIALALLWYNQLTAVCFDPEFARLRGLKVEALYVLLLCLAALTVVVLVTAVGLILVIALLALPAAAAGRLSRSLWQMMIGAALLTALASTGGIALSYTSDLPSGAMTILLAAGGYLATVGVAAVRERRGNGG
ncbi:MAG: iron chelate uptake ABC transporter family permease subunit [Armatimonadia bacterium]|nr:iron chelate uptake ABC transporter family permease subunit [Armatimonadia bacterium]